MTDVGQFWFVFVIITCVLSVCVRPTVEDGVFVMNVFRRSFADHGLFVRFSVWTESILGGVGS